MNRYLYVTAPTIEELEERVNEAANQLYEFEDGSMAYYAKTGDITIINNRERGTVTLVQAMDLVELPSGDWTE